MPVDYSNQPIWTKDITPPANFDTSAKGHEEKRCSADAVLRLHGFRIHSRPKRGPVIWSRRGCLYEEEEAQRIANRVKVGKQS